MTPIEKCQKCNKEVNTETDNYYWANDGTHYLCAQCMKILNEILKKVFYEFVGKNPSWE